MQLKASALQTHPATGPTAHRTQTSELIQLVPIKSWCQFSEEIVPFYPNIHSFHYVWEPYITQDIQIGNSRLEILWKLEGFSLVEHSVCGPRVIVNFSRQGYSSVSLEDRNNLLHLGVKLTHSIYFEHQTQTFGWFSQGNSSVLLEDRNNLHHLGVNFLHFMDFSKVFLVKQMRQTGGKPILDNLQVNYDWNYFIWEENGMNFIHFWTLLLHLGVKSVCSSKTLEITLFSRGFHVLWTFKHFASIWEWN